LLLAVAKKKAVKKEESIKTSKKNYLPLIIAVLVILAVAVFVILSVSKPKLEIGDVVELDYVGSLEDGTIFDTSIQEIGTQAGLERTKYSTLTITLGSGSLIQGFEEALVGMKKGETKTVTIPVEKAYGEVKGELILRDLKREIKATKYSLVDREVFNTVFAEKPEVGKILEREEVPWKLKISKLNQTTVVLEGMPTIGDKLMLPGAQWETEVIAITDKEIVLFQYPELDKIVSFPTELGVVRGKVVKVDDTSFDVDTNHRLAGKTLIFKITIVELTKKSDLGNN